MKPKAFITMMFVMALITACGAPAETPAEDSATLPALTDSSGVTAEGRLEPVRFAEIAFNTSGVISEGPVEEGQTVRKGETLVKIGNEFDASYAAAQLELVNAQQALNDLHQTAGTDLARTVIDLKEAKEDYDKAYNYLDYLKTAQKVPQTINKVILVQTWRGYQYEYKTRNFKGPAPKDWIIEAENDLALKKANMDNLQRTYDRMKDGVDIDRLALLEARLNAAQAKVSAFSVVAPFDGVVTDMKAKAGSSINAGEIAVTVADVSEWLVKTTDLTEIDVVELNEGQPVVVTLDALPDLELTGEILSIGQSYAENQGDVVYEVVILLTETHPAMRWGMTAEVRFNQE